MAGAAAHYAVVVFVEVVEVAADGAERHHALDLGGLDFHVNAPLGDAGDVAVELLADFVFHEFHQLVLDALAFGFRGDDFAFGGVLALGGVVVRIGRILAGKIS